MNELQKAAEMALEALEDVFGKEKKDVGAINALRQALAQPKREWVGLTTVEVVECQEAYYYDTYSKIEAKLKEKNT